MYTAPRTYLRPYEYVQSPTSSPSHTSEDVLDFQTFRGNEWANKGESISVTGKEGGVWTFDVKAGSGKEYFFERSGFSPLSVLKSPMILIAIATMGVVFGMPYLMDNSEFLPLLSSYLGWDRNRWSNRGRVICRVIRIYANKEQWIRNYVLSSRRGRRVVHSVEEQRRILCKVSMLRLGWLGRVVRRRGRIPIHHRREGLRDDLR